jgi:hypothetical protein
VRKRLPCSASLSEIVKVHLSSKGFLDSSWVVHSKHLEPLEATVYRSALPGVRPGPCFVRLQGQNTHAGYYEVPRSHHYSLSSKAEVSNCSHYCQSLIEWRASLTFLTYIFPKRGQSYKTAIHSGCKKKLLTITRLAENRILPRHKRIPWTKCIQMFCKSSVSLTISNSIRVNKNQCQLNKELGWQWIPGLGGMQSEQGINKNSLWLLGFPHFFTRAFQSQKGIPGHQTAPILSLK